MIVTLSYAEMQLAFTVAAQRQVMNMKVGTKARYGAPEEFDAAMGVSMIGCAGEMAVAKGLNLFWSGSVGDYDAVDVGGKVEVRSITRPGDSLILHPKDRDGMPFVLCHNMPGTTTFELKGWIWGKQGKDERFWRDPQRSNRHAFFVPQSELFDCEELGRQVHAHDI